MRNKLMAALLPLTTIAAAFGSMAPAQAAGTCNGGNRIENSDTSGTVNFHDCTLSDLNPDDNGGAVINTGKLTLTNVVLSGNTAHSKGGAIYNLGELTLNNVTLTGNHATGNGGAVYSSGVLHITGGTIGGTGALGNTADADADLTGVTITGNATKNHGGGLWNDGDVLITRSTFRANSAVYGGGVWNEQRMHLVQSTIDANLASKDGGGISDVGNDEEGSPGNTTDECSAASSSSSEATLLSLDRVTISNNQAVNGGGISDLCARVTGGDLSTTASTQRVAASPHGIVASPPATNVTLVGNVASGKGGGVRAIEGSVVSLLNATIADNTAAQDGGGGVWAANGGQVDLQSTLLARNQPTACAAENSSEIAGLGGANSANIETGHSCGFTGASDKVDVTDPGLASSLADNFGFVKTLALKRGSVAIDSVPGGCPPPPVDARDLSRPQADKCDTGAYECIGTAPVVSQVSPNNGAPEGGTQVTITGANFDRPATVLFGTKTAQSVVINSATSITATSPPGTPSSVNVTVQTCRADSPTSGTLGAFTYNGPPSAAAVVTPTLPKAGAGPVATAGPAQVAAIVGGLLGLLLLVVAGCAHPEVFRLRVVKDQR